MRLWRLCKRDYAAGAFTGEGAKLAGGRWNPEGFAVVYTSASLSLAVVETLVHLDIAEAPVDYLSIEAEIALDREWGARSAILERLPSDWRREDHPALRRIGLEWLESKRSLAMPVPSAAVDGEWNVLINPLHPDAAKIRIEKPKPFRFDERMFRGK